MATGFCMWGLVSLGKEAWTVLRFLWISDSVAVVCGGVCGTVESSSGIARASEQVYILVFSVEVWDL